MQLSDLLNNSKKENKEIEQLINLFRDIESILQMTITLSQKIKIIKIIYKLKKSKEIDENFDVAEMILFNLFKGLFEFRNRSRKFKSFINLFKNKKLWIYEEDKSTLFKKEINGKLVIKSHNTQLYIEKPDSSDNPVQDIAFTEKFCENLDIIHFSMKLNIPLILEGMLGYGKKTALNYVFKLLNIKESNIINIYLSDNTKKEDLLGKITATTEKDSIKVDFIKTDLLKALVNENQETYAIIFHNLNKASPGIFELLENIFDHSKERILLPNGENIKKNDENPPYLFGIFDSETGKINRNSLPKFFFRTCIYFIVQNPHGGDTHKIITSKFKSKEYKLEANYFEDKFLLASQIQNNYTSSDNTNPLSLNDINKFIALRDITYLKLDISIISQFIFVYRHTENEKIQEIIKQLKFKEFNFVPKFTFSKEKLIIEIEDTEENEDENIKKDIFQSFDLKLKNQLIDTENILKRFNTLTKPQKHCLLFLSCSILTNYSIILQGNTNSGKTHLITLFAEMLGKKLHVYQMNKDINLTMIFGQSSIRRLNIEERREINRLCKELSNEIGHKNDYYQWNKSNYSKLCNEFEKYPKNKDNYNKALEIYEKIKEKISITKRFQSIPSPFCKALENGDWILIEQIESAPNEIIEKLIPLCDEKPELKIIKGIEEITYKIDNKGGFKKINRDFRIFFTYNPYNREKKIHPSLFSKCLVFTLPQIDSTLEYCSKIYYGKLKNINYPLNLSKELSGRLSNVHKIAKEDSNKGKLDSDIIRNNDGIFTGRTIKFISNEITNLEKNKMKYEENINVNYLNNIIHSTFEHYYYNSFDSSKDEKYFKIFRDDIRSLFTKKPPNFETEDDVLFVIYHDIYQDINIIKTFIENKENEEKYKFSLSNFLYKTLSIKLMHLNEILNYINSIDLKVNINNPNIFVIYQGFQTIKKLLETINEINKKKELDNLFYRLIISDSKFFGNIKTKICCSKLILYNLLLKNNYIISENIIPEFLTSSIMKLSKTKDFNDFKNLILLLNKYPNMFEILKKIFPFSKIIDEKELTGEKEKEEDENEVIKNLKNKNSILVLWLELFYKYWENNINFKIQINEDKFEFKFGEKNNSILNPTFSFNEKSRYFLTKKSFFFYLNEENKEDIHKIENVSRAESYLFYQLLLKFSNYKKYLPSYEQYYNAIENSKEETEERALFKKYLKKENNKFNFYLKLNKIKQNKNIEEPKIINNESDEDDDDFDEEDKNNEDNEGKEFDISIVKNILTLYFNYSKQFFDEIMDNYFNPVEKGIYKLLIENFDDKLNRNDYMIYSDLIRMVDIFFNNYIYLFDEHTEDILNNAKERNIRLQNLDKALESLLEIKNKFEKFNFESFLKILMEKKTEIEGLNENYKNELEKQNIIDSLDVYKNDNNKKLIENAKAKIKNLDSNNVKIWKKVFITPKEEEEIQSNLWPMKIKLIFENDELNGEISEKHKIFIDTLLRFSEIKKILDENLDNDNNINKNNFFQMLVQLSEYDEMRNISNYIFNKIDNDYSISPKVIKILNSVLNCSFIKNLIEFCYNKEKGEISFKTIEEMFKYFNDLRYRLIDKNEIQYIFIKYSSKYKPTFKIRFPIFKGMDLIYLFIDINNNCEVINNFILEDIKLSKTCLERIINIEVNSDKDNYLEYLNMIVTILFEELKNINNENKKYLLNIILKSEKDIQIKNLCKILLKLYDEKELDILRKKYIFNLNEVGIYKCLENIKLIDHAKFYKYPSLIFFMLEYKFDGTKLFLNKYEDNTNVEEKNEFLPFWLFCLRYFSSIECINSKESNYFSKIIDKKIKAYFKRELKRKENYEIRLNWLNFVCYNNKSIFYEPLYEKIKLFLYKLSNEDLFSNLNNKSYIHQIINNICENYIKTILDIVLKDDIKN